MPEGIQIRHRSREARRLARSRRGMEKLPFIRRKLPEVQLLSTEAIEVIEWNAETILEEIGVEFRRDPESIQLWKQAGADVQQERVHIPRGMCRQLLAPAPREFSLHARNPERTVRFGGDSTVFAPVSGRHS
jgi:trimethylamine--corrinoid protein Co-methyltransferase